MVKKKPVKRQKPTPVQPVNASGGTTYTVGFNETTKQWESWLDDGRELHETYMNLVRREFDAARDLVLSKGNDYDWSIFEPPVLNTRLSPLDGIDARMSDKIKRLCALISGTKEAKVKESIEDTLRDLSAYCILRVIAMELKGGKS